MKTIYLTGTVNDMQAEYEAIRDITMPEINRFLAEYDEEAILCGMGDTSSDEACRKELKSCFRESKKDSTYFVTLMGEKYGDVPSNDVTEGLLEKSGIEVDENVNGKSVYEIEVMFAALLNNDKALFYMREPFVKKELGSLQRKAFLAGFGEGGKVKALKKAVRANAKHLHEYELGTENGAPSAESAEEFAKRLSEDLKILLTDDLKKEKPETVDIINKLADEEETAKIPEMKEANAPINIEPVATPIWDAVKNGELYNPEKLRDEAVKIGKNAMLLEQKDPEKAGDLYDESLEIFTRIREDEKKGGCFNDELGKLGKDDPDDNIKDESKRLNKRAELIAGECIRDMGLTYGAYARIEFNAKNFDGAAAWAKQAIDSFTQYHNKYKKLQAVIDISNMWLLMSASCANAGNLPEAIDSICATMSHYDFLVHTKGYQPPNDFGQRYQSAAQMAFNICIQDKTGECSKKWLKFCQQQSFNLSKAGDNQGMINYVNFSIAIFENQIYKQNNAENLMQYINMLHEISQMFLRMRNGEMLGVLADKGRNLLEVAGNDERVVDIVCSIVTLQANYYFSAGEQEKALDNYREVIEKRSVYETSDDWGKRLVIAADNARMASALTELSRLDEAKEHYEKAIAIIEGLDNCKKEEKLYGELASAYMNYSVCLGKLGRKDDALKMIETASGLVEGKKLNEQGLMLLRRRIRKMLMIAKSKNAKQMYDPELMEAAKSEIERIQQVDGVFKQNDFETGAMMLEKALMSLKELNVIDIVLPSEAYAANMTVCGNVYEEKLNNKEKAMDYYKQAWAVLSDMEHDGIKVNPNLVENLKKRMGNQGKSNIHLVK